MRTLYVSDLDGTLLCRDQRISGYTARTINRLVGEGMQWLEIMPRTASKAQAA